MATFFTVLLTVLLVLDCLILGLLIIIQLPKKEAGVGMAFGGGTADALFGAGSGTALSNLTRNATIAFFVLVLGISIASRHQGKAQVNDLQRELQNLPVASETAPASKPVTAPVPSSAPAIPLMISTNAPATPAK